MSYIKKTRTISVAMAIYNCAPTLREAIDSIVNQTYKDWELILCDDCSTDNTLDIAKEYETKYDNILVLKNERNIGLPASLNHCIEYAQGAFIARMDGDDISLPERFEKEIAVLESHPEYAIVSCAMINFDENGDWGIQRKPEHPVKTDFVFDSPVCHAPCIMRKDALADVGNYTVRKDLRRGQDYYLWHKFYCKGYQAYNIQEPYYKMRDDKNAVARRKLKSRIHGLKIQLEVTRNLKLPIWYYPFALRGILVGLLPDFMYERLHQKKIKAANRRMGDGNSITVTRVHSRAEDSQEMISIIVPVYNTSAYLTRCLDSLLAQTYPNIELICVNDGSTDNSLEILKYYSSRHSNLKVFDRDNEGVSSSRNFGISKSSGKWIMFVDSDDWLEHDAVKQAYNAGQIAHADIISFDYICEYSKGHEYRYHGSNDAIYRGADFFLRILGPIATQLNEPHKLESMSCAKLYRKEVLDGCTFIDLKRIGTSEDTLFNLMIAKKNVTALYLHYAGYHYRKTNQQATTQTYKLNLIEKWDALYEIIDNLVDTPVEREAFANRVACSLIGSGINEMKGNASICEKRAWVKNTLNKERYRHAFSGLNLKYISSLKWKLFFYSAKHRNYTIVTFLLWTMNKILTIKKGK